MNVLVVGSGGREHALCWAIAKSSRCDKLYCAPGNAGIAQVAACIKIASEDLLGIVAFSKEKNIDLVVIGPEGPLVQGLVDKLLANGIKAFGPSRAAAHLEGSKAFMKDLFKKFDIPTADYECFTDFEKAVTYIKEKGTPIVVKASGLASGKGVILCDSEEEAIRALKDILQHRVFGKAGNEVVIEEFLFGEEVSFFALVDGTTALPLVSAQDHKAAYDGDKGPNTGGMGAYSPAPVITGVLANEIMDQIIRPTIKALVAEGRPYTGLLYAGLMITDNGPKVLEYNVRFGDPECQVLMARLESDVLEAFEAAISGRLNEIEVKDEAGYYTFSSFGNSFTQIITRDSRNHPEFPTNGSRSIWTSTLSGAFLGGSQDYHKHEFDFNWFTPLHKKFTISQIFKIGILAKIDEENGKRSIIPPSAKFVMGGSGIPYGEMLRGYTENRVGPFGSTRGGNVMLKYSMELRLSLSDNPTIYALSFFDMGNVWSEFDVMDPFDLKRSAGFGVRVFIPMLGMLGYDIGYGFDTTDYDTSINNDDTKPHGWEYHLIFGMPF